MSPPGKYLYCIIRCPHDRTFEDVASFGGAGSPVSTVSHRGLAVVVSDSPAARYDSSRANMLAHERVLERVMREYTLLPVRFGTVANGDSPVEAIRALLDRRLQEFEGLLAEMEGKVELGLKALWRDHSAVFQEIAAQDQGIRRLRDSVAGKPPEATHYQRLRLGEMAQQALDKKRAAEAAALLGPLRKIAQSMVENPAITDRMVLNAAFLVDRAREEEFDRATARLDQELGRRLAFKYVGPVPPYNFVNVTVSWQEL